MKWVTIVVMVCFSAQLCLGTTINVPDEQPTIQAGIDTAANGDTVLVAQGTYTENINRTRTEAFMDSPWNIILVFVVPGLTALLGYFVGSVKFFKEEQHKMYGELLPSMLKFGYDRQMGDQTNLNIALAKVWLYVNSSSALKIDKVIGIYLKAQEKHGGKFTKEDQQKFTAAMQAAIISMRMDVQPWWRITTRWLRKEDVKHLYLKLMQSEKPENDKAG